MFKFSKRSYRNLKDIHPELITVLVISIKNSPYDFTLTNGVRTTSDQRELYAKGRTLPGNIVTNSDGIQTFSKHQIQSDGFGYAVDLYPYFNGTVHTEGEDVNLRLTAIARHIIKTAKELDITIQWGGDWKNFKDTPHFELKK
ncbi:M15 family metallopeptidase [Apibacter raozihei]|uniref:M15 family metallopeptidase n=1 Tax=Apibacter raozihei TaxID=2500547 RepID=UPI000FE3446C|nr:M15 family metallopeptidase [Apibacter raozihei]